MTTTKTKEGRMTTTKTKEFSPKHTNFKNETQKKHFNLWLELCVEFAPLSTITLRDAYSNYCHLLEEYYKSVPLSKKLFSINLRLTFEKEIEDTKQRKLKWLNKIHGNSFNKRPKNKQSSNASGFILPLSRDMNAFR